MSRWLAAGFTAGLLGAAVMVAWSMTAGVLSGVGMWSLLSMRSGRLLGFGPAATQAGAALLGVVLALATGTLLGGVCGAVAGSWGLRAPGSQRVRRYWAAGGAVVGLLLWLLTAFGAVQPWGPAVPTPLGQWVLAIGYILYGTTAAAYLASAAPRRTEQGPV